MKYKELNELEIKEKRLQLNRNEIEIYTAEFNIDKWKKDIEGKIPSKKYLNLIRQKQCEIMRIEQDIKEGLPEREFEEAMKKELEGIEKMKKVNKKMEKEIREKKEEIPELLPNDKN